MRFLLVPSWRSRLLLAAAAVFVVSMLGAATRSVAAELFGEQAPSEQKRSATARENTTGHQLEPVHGRKRDRALVSFRQGLELPVALATLKKTSPGSTPVVVTSYNYDATGQRHVTGVMLRPGEDPKEKVPRFVAGFTEETRRRARDLLACTSTKKQVCPVRGTDEKRRLTAQSLLAAETSLVYGIVVEGSVTELERLRPDRDVIAAVEIVGDNPFVSPISPPIERNK